MKKYKLLSSQGRRWAPENELVIDNENIYEMANGQRSRCVVVIAVVMVIILS